MINHQIKVISHEFSHDLVVTNFITDLIGSELFLMPKLKSSKKISKTKRKPVTKKKPKVKKKPAKIKPKSKGKSRKMHPGASSSQAGMLSELKQGAGSGGGSAKDKVHKKHFLLELIQKTQIYNTC